VRSASLLVVAAVVSGCTYDIPELVTDGAHDAASAADGPTTTHPVDGGVDSTTSGDAATGPTVYSDFGDVTKWTAFDTSLVTNGPESFGGGAFDGRHVYFAPSGGASSFSVVPQFDTAASGGFVDSTSWTIFNTQAVRTNAQGFVGALFDGAQSLYLTPFAIVSGTPDGVVPIYDTKDPFTSAGSWTAFDTSTVNTNAQGFSGETFDGRYLYLVPSVKGTTEAPNGLVARCDTQASCTNASAWTFFDMSVLNPNATGFLGAVFDGRYVNFIPSYASIAVRYDTQGAGFGDMGAWSWFDTQPVAAQSPGFGGGAFDGRYVYYVPGFYTSSMGSTFLSNVVRFDTTQSFTMAGSWSSFDVSALGPSAKGFAGAAFDGRFVYFVPYAVNAPSQGTLVFDGTIVRYDTTASFGSATSWGTFDTSQLKGAPQGFFGAVFDGEYLYLIPSGTTVAVRFDAKTPRSMPALPQFQGSFL
jgi:hypothetical protein